MQQRQFHKIRKNRCTSGTMPREIIHQIRGEAGVCGLLAATLGPRQRQKGASKTLRSPQGLQTRDPSKEENTPGQILLLRTVRLAEEKSKACTRSGCLLLLASRCEDTPAAIACASFRHRKVPKRAEKQVSGQGNSSASVHLVLQVCRQLQEQGGTEHIPRTAKVFPNSAFRSQDCVRMEAHSTGLVAESSSPGSKQHQTIPRSHFPVPVLPVVLTLV